jgi:acetylornithine deacetylase/succinyl-diaminopimelate desuccinylase-like protein
MRPARRHARLAHAAVLSLLACLTVPAVAVAPLSAQQSAPAAAAAPSVADYRKLGRDVLKELIETDTTHSTGSTTVAAERMAARLLAAGFPRADVQVVGTAPRKGNLVARLRGSGGNSARKPLLFIAHLDVVEARREDWSLDPFTLTERDGYFYARGTEDVKGGAATLVTAFARMRQEGFTPDRDLILALTADEEGGPDNGIQWLLEHRKELIDAAYCINVDSGGGELRAGKVAAIDVQASEKVFLSFTLTTRNAGGHSSIPTSDNAIYRLAAGLQRLAGFTFPTRTSEITRGYFSRMADILPGPLSPDMKTMGRLPQDEAAAARLSAASPYYNALLRTTCVPTLLQGGHAENALPQMAQATVNCRMLPEDKPDDVQQTLVRVLADPQIIVALVAPAVASPPSPLAPEVFTAIAAVSRTIWGNVPTVSYMETGATDGLLLRNAGIPVYGVTGIAHDADDVRAHGKDERIPVRAFDEGLEFIYQLAARLSGRADAARVTR